MELRDMTPKEIIHLIEGLLTHATVAWGDSIVAEPWAELKRKCGAKPPEFPLTAEFMQGMDIKELLRSLTNCANNVGWDHRHTRQLRADLKRRIYWLASRQDAWEARDRYRCPVMGHYVAGVDKGGPEPDKSVVQVCPVAGKGVVWVDKVALEPSPYTYVCGKCGKTRLRVHVNEGTPCPACVASKPDAPSGYEHVGEWRLVEFDEHFLCADGTAAKKTAFLVPDVTIDDGKRWILREVEQLCPKCGKPMPNAVPDWPCVECHMARPPAKPGYEYTGEWRKPGKGEFYLTHPRVCEYESRSLAGVRWAELPPKSEGGAALRSEDGPPGHLWGPSDRVDQGRRWILREVEKRPRLHPANLSDMVVAQEALTVAIGALARRVVNLEKKQE